MRKEDLSATAVIAEAVAVILGIVYVILQIYYGIIYHIAAYKFVCNIVGVILIYAGLTLLSCYPEKINRLPAEKCVGPVRSYSVWMVRLVKLVFIAGLMIPCVSDVLGIEMRDAYSLIVVAALLCIAVFCEYKIIRTMHNDDHGTD